MVRQHCLVDARVVAGINIEPMEVAVEDKRFRATLALVGLDQRVERKWIAVQASGNPQRLHFE